MCVNRRKEIVVFLVNTELNTLNEDGEHIQNAPCHED